LSASASRREVSLIRSIISGAKVNGGSEQAESPL
jgi:hypothetical protein